MSAAASSAFPQSSEHEMDAQFGMVTKQNQMVPGWYMQNQHPDPDNTHVMQAGVPLVPSFTVGQMAFCRRWCVGLDGNLMGQNEFEVKLTDVRHEYYALLRSRGRDAQFQGNMGRESKPAILRFASKKVNPEDERKLMDIHYDPYKTAGAEPDHFVDAKGEKVEGDRLQILVEAYHNPKLRAALTGKELTLVEAHLGTSVPVSGNNVIDKLEVLNDLLADGTIDKETHSQKVAALTGAPAPEKAEAAEAAPVEAKPERPKRKAPMHTAACGERIYNLHKGRHAKKCEKPACVAAREDAS